MIKQKTEVRGQKLEVRSRKLTKLVTRYSLLVTILLLTAYCLLLFPSTGHSEDGVEVHGLRHWITDGQIRIVVDLSSTADVVRGRLSNPERLYFDIKNAKLKKDIQTSYTLTDRFLKRVRAGQFDANTVRIVFDLESEEYSFKTNSLENPRRFVVDIFPLKDQGKRDLKTGPNAEVPTGDNFPDSHVTQFIKKTVVIDAGHGGHDPGAVGHRGLYEKDVVLDIALKVREILKKEHPIYNVVLTRDRDVFIPLEKRAEIANRVNADLFISIHANASRNRDSRGIETFLLNWTDDEEAMKVAARENAISLKKMKQVQNELAFILASLERESKREESVKLAGYIHKSMVSTVKPKHPDIDDRGLKQALFFVLVGAKMPSALLEVGFISNPEEERLLADEAFRQKIAYSIAAGINIYFMSAPLQKVAGSNDATVNKGYKIRQVRHTRITN